MKKSKMECIFLLCLMGVISFSLLCVTGCGDTSSCEKVKYGNLSDETGTTLGLSIPGCGGCLGCACGSCLWPQALKCSLATDKEEGSTYLLFDNVYYSVGCLGNLESNSFYSGIFFQDKDNFVAFYGVDSVEEKEESTMGCSSGKFKKKDTDGIWYDVIKGLEFIEGIE